MMNIINQLKNLKMSMGEGVLFKFLINKKIINHDDIIYYIIRMNDCDQVDFFNDLDLADSTIYEPKC